MRRAGVFEWRTLIQRLGERFASRVAEHDENDRFVHANWEELKQEKLFSAMVPEELGGAGLSHPEMCNLIREMAQYCPSTALAFSMHQHLVAAAVWNYRQGKPGEKLLRGVADSETKLVSTGANDWLSSSGRLEPCEGGFRFSATKAFASGSPAGDLLVTSGRYRDPKEGWQVLHFPVSLRAGGVSILENWKAMGMRGSGSNTVILDNVFVAADSIGLRRPMGKYHRVWDVVLTVALPLVGGAYLGVAEASGRIARESAIRRGDDGVTCELLGELENELTTARLAFDSMVAVTNNFEFQPSPQKTSEVLVRKTILTQAVIRTASKALEVTGGGYFRSQGLERLLRDAYAGQFHPLPPRKQHRFTGRLAMGLGVNEDSESGS
jgi:alkylation response protein AidB-like acyl-CoA dehydrogenase